MDNLKSRNSSFTTMADRLGISIHEPKVTENGTPIVSDYMGMLNHHQYNIEDDRYNLVTWERNNLLKPDPEVEGIQHMMTRLKADGGFDQQSRMVYDKKRSLDRALRYSYQGANVRKDNVIIENESEENEQIENPIVRALINPDKNKRDYDDKIISIPYEFGYKSGDVFEWVGTNTHWLIYLQDLDELAYFRGEIRRCSYQISWEEEDGIHTTYAAVRGPVETKIDYIQKHQISVDNPNYSLHILLPRTESNLKQFRRYSKFYLQDIENGAPNVCWRVEATDWISTPGILEINAVEYYANETEDDVDAGLVGSLIVKQEDPNIDNDKAGYIEGETFIKPLGTYQYTFQGLNVGTWKVDTKKYPIRYSINPNDNRQIKIIWDKQHSGQFEISYGNFTKTIVVESLF